MKKKNPPSNSQPQVPAKGVSSRLHSLYMKLPSFPYLDRQATALFLASMLLYFLFVAFVYLQSPSSQITYKVSEPHLYPTSTLSFQPGERYTYKITPPNSQQFLLNYRVLPPANCKGMLILEEESGEKNCFSPSGKLLSSPQESNFSYGNHSITLFTPWMSALSDNSNWKLQGTASSSGVEVSMASVIRTVGSSPVAGRSAYAVEVLLDNAPGAQMYVDKEKRILLLSSQQGVLVQLVAAPFPLDWNSTSSTPSNN